MRQIQQPSRFIIWAFVLLLGLPSLALAYTAKPGDKFKVIDDATGKPADRVLVVYEKLDENGEPYWIADATWFNDACCIERKKNFRASDMRCSAPERCEYQCNNETEPCDGRKR